ncbi:MAG: GNAT family N-acetyltransferase [Trueperaceae bacterium]
MSERMRVRQLPPGDAPPPLHPELDVFRTPAQQAEALAEIASDPNGQVWIAEEGGLVVAYVTFHPPGDVETWGDDRTGALIELGAIEVAPSLRGERLAERLLEAAFAGDAFSDTVVFATMYVWHYDLVRSGLRSFAYKRLLERLYRKAGLVAMPTSDPEVRADPANALMVRIGPNADPAVVREFHRLRTRPPSAFG